MNVAKYHRFVSTIEATEWFRDQVQNGDLKITYYPHTKSLCRRGSVGAITENGFLFSCEHFAVTYNLSPTVAIDKNWHTLRHINQRNSIAHRIIEIIILLQQEYLVSQDPITLRQLPYQQIITEYKRLYPDSYMDASVISRLVKTILLEVNGKTTLLNELLPGKSYLSGLRIEKLLKTTDPLLTDEDLQRNLANKFDLHVTRRYVSYCRNLMGIPDVRLRRKKDFHFFHWDSTGRYLSSIKRWILSRKFQVSISSAGWKRLRNMLTAHPQSFTLVRPEISIIESKPTCTVMDIRHQ